MEVEPARAFAPRRGEETQRAAVEEQARGHSGLAQQPFHAAVGRGFELAAAADDTIEVLAGLEDPHEKLPRGRAVLRIELAHGEVGTKRLAVVGKRHLELGWDRALVRARVALWREAPAENGLSEGAEIGQVRDRAFLGIERRAPRRNARRSRCPSASRRSRIAPARTRAGAETTRPVGGRNRSTRGAQRLEGRASPWCSVRLRPEVDEPDGLDALCAHFVELADALWLHLEISVELIEPAAPRAHVGFELALLLLVEIEGELLELRPRAFRALRERACRWRSRVSCRSLASRSPRFRSSSMASTASSSARGSSCGRSSSMSRGAAARSFRWIVSLERTSVVVAERALEEVERLCLRISCVGLREAPCAEMARPSAP